MTRIIAEISMSLDGFVTGPNPSLEQGLGQGGEALHGWVFDDNPIDQATLRESTEGTGAVVMGRRLFDIIDGPHGWSDTVGYGGHLNVEPPLVVVTHQQPARVRLKRPISFITTGLPAALEAARQAAGQRNVVIMGGGDVIFQALSRHLVDELRLHLVPVILGGGTPLFQPGHTLPLVQTAVRISPVATHLTYRPAPV
jgi:dihydrofolate reductase